MISAQSFTKDWILGRRERGREDPILVEKQIHALALVESLSAHLEGFVFKGGTSLVLLFDSPRRLSIDIDIILPIDRQAELSEVLEPISRSFPFQGVVEDVRRNSGAVPKSHYKFQYQSPIEGRESHVLLDVLYEDHQYVRLINKDLSSPVLDMIGAPSKVCIPSAEGLLGDKLTAFAPMTTGIPFGIGKELEIIKQLYDVSCLIEIAEDIEEVRATHERIARKESEYRGKAHTTHDVLVDALKTALVILLRKGGQPDCYPDLAKGIQRLKGFVLDEVFNDDAAVRCAAKVACLAACLLTSATQMPRIGLSIEDSLVGLEIRHPQFLKLNRLRNHNPQAFFHISHALRALEHSIDSFDI